MENIQEKNKILENKRKLRNVRGLRMYINNDLTKNEREIQKEVREHAKQYREKGKK